jgi:hypothetical protein
LTSISGSVSLLGGYITDEDLGRRILGAFFQA